MKIEEVPLGQQNCLNCYYKREHLTSPIRLCCLDNQPLPLPATNWCGQWAKHPDFDPDFNPNFEVNQPIK